MGRIIEKMAYADLYEKVASGEKTFDCRLADWVCEPGDTLVLIEVDETTRQPTGRSLRRKVGFVGKTKDFDFWSKEDIDKHGYQIISLLEES